MGRPNSNIGHYDSYINCHICKTSNNVDKQVYRIETDNTHGNQFAAKHCDKCKTLITVVVGMCGVRSIESELIRIEQEKIINP